MPNDADDELEALEQPEMPEFDEAAARDGDIVEVGVRSGPLNAEMARAELAAEGIPSRMMGTGGGVFGGVLDTAIRIVVPASYAERAAEILRRGEEGGSADEPDEDDAESDD